MLSIASSHCILTISRDFYRKIRWRLSGKFQRRLGTETTLLDLTWSSQVDWTAASDCKVICWSEMPAATVIDKTNVISDAGCAMCNVLQLYNVSWTVTCALRVCWRNICLTAASARSDCIYVVYAAVLCV